MTKRTTLFGPPGSGKTTKLSEWSRKVAERHGGENVMICSLTKTAATEIRSRATNVPNENVGTLHAHAYRSIRDDELTVMTAKNAVEFNADVPSLFHIPIVKADTDDVAPNVGSAVASNVDLLRTRCVPLDQWHQHAQQFYSLYTQFKESRKLLDFTDMIDHALAHSDCPSDYVIMDEAQDCSALEYKLLEKWAGQCEGVVIAGDDDQAAYEWRGASVDAFLKFAEDQRVLPRSYRLPKMVKEYADRWIHRISNRKEKEYEPRAENGLVAELDTNRPEDIVEHALRQPGTSMILTTCGYMTQPFVACLKENAEPFCNPYRLAGEYASLWNPFMTGSARSVTAADSLRSFLTLPPTRRSLFSWVKEISSEKLNHGTKTTLKKERSSEELVPVQELLTLLGEEGFSRYMEHDVDWFVANVLDQKRKEMLAYRARVFKKHGLRGIEPSSNIIVGTIHSVKGGQADNVYVVPDLSQAGREAWVRAEDPIIRQLYIAMTRAKQQLFLVRPKVRSVIQW
jgi:DNA helicase-2/ATP-dependent DNA helicase PcrA